MNIVNLSEAALLALCAVLEAADLARVRVGGAEPSFEARLVYKRHRTSAVARRQKHFADASVVTDTTYWAACRATNITSRHGFTLGRRGAIALPNLSLAPPPKKKSLLTVIQGASFGGLEWLIW